MRRIAANVWLFSGTMALAVTVGCGKGKAPPPVIQPPVTAPAPAAEAKEEIPGIRTQGGTPIAPVVITDQTPSPAAAPVAAAANHAPAATLNGNPQGLTRASLNQAMGPVIGKIASCFSPGMGNPMVSLSFEAEPTGRASMLRVRGAPADSEACIRKIMQETRIPSFEGKAVPIDLPLSFHQVGKAENPKTPTAPTPRPSAPLFMDP